MNIHKNARLTPLRREEMALSAIEGPLSKSQAKRMYGVSGKIVARWVERFKAEGRSGMADLSSRPKVVPNLTDQAVADRIITLRRQRWTGQHIALEVDVSPATVSRELRRAGLSRLRDIDPAEPVRRYERDHPGEMIHIDIKKLGRFSQVGHRITGDPQQGKSRGAGWEFVHVCIDDASRVAFSQSLPQARAQACQDTALHSEDQRQGRAFHPDRIARMGIRRRLPKLGQPRCRAASLAASIQLAPSARQPKV